MRNCYYLMVNGWQMSVCASVNTTVHLMGQVRVKGKKGCDLIEYNKLVLNLILELLLNASILVLHFNAKS